MLTIYDRQKNAVGMLNTSGYYKEVSEVTVQRRLNSDYTLSFLIPMQSEKYGLLEKEGLIECEGQKYIIKGFERKREGMGRTVQVTCPHIMRRLMDIKIPYTSAVDESLGADISDMLTIISNATSGVFTFEVMDTIAVKDVYKWGYSNCLKALQDLVTLYEVEFVPDNYNIKIYSKIAIDNGAQYRFAKNIMSASFKDNTDTLCTRITGLAKDSLTIIDLPTSHLTTDEYDRLNAISGAIVGGIIKVPYIISQYASTWATPDNAFFDSDFEDTDIDASDEAGKVQLLEVMRKKLAASEIPDIQIEIEAADLWKIYDGQRPTIGETVYLIDKDMDMNSITARVMELTEYPFDPSKNSPVTLANFILKDMNDIVSGLSSSKNVLDGLLTNKNVNTSAFEAFAKQAINDINASKSQIIYDSRGIVLQDATNNLHQVILTANGIVVTEDGGITANTAITGQGIAAQYIVGLLGDFAYIKAQNIDVSGGKITAAQIDATNLHVSVANINGSLIVGTNVGLGTAQDSAGVTSIIGGTVTTSFINALNVTANSVNAGWVYAGNINAGQISGGTITGITFKTGATGTRHIELNANTLKGYDTSNNLHGLIFDPTNTSNFFDIAMYHAGTRLLEFIDNGSYINIQAASGASWLGIGGNGKTTYPGGSWDFSGATVSGLSVTAKFK